MNDNLGDEAFKPVLLNFWPDADNVRSSNPSLRTIEQANKILTGEFQLFGIADAPINLDPRYALHHWSHKPIPIDGFEKLDVKFIWEPARFSWAIKLAQAYHLTKDDKYVKFFWDKFTEFNKKNPYNLGPNWESAQEVALRLIAFTIAYNLMANSAVLAKKHKVELLRSIANHALRIPPTLAYAKAQNNNHLLSEAVGLYTAGIFLPHHPHAKKWEYLGSKLFNNALQNQIKNNGEYVQYSTNYHRMMLMLTLWMNALHLDRGSSIGLNTKEKLDQAVGWLLGHFDPISGRVSNLGHNDGSHILPFSSFPFCDYRPILSAANRAFSKGEILEAGEWDDLALWLGLSKNVDQNDRSNSRNPYPPARIGDKQSWATIQSVQYTSRPAHADQLHISLWHKGFNVTLDPGTFQYNAPPPWDNGLARSRVHNTVTIDDQDQMLRASRFLWLDWAQSRLLKQSEKMICAEHYGYKNRNAVHRRTLHRLPNDSWEIKDFIYPVKLSKQPIQTAIHWLFPNWRLEQKADTFLFSAPFGLCKLQISTQSQSANQKYSVYHQGLPITEVEKKRPLLGWYSPTYGIKYPAYSILFTIEGKMPIMITSRFIFS